MKRLLTIVLLLMLTAATYAQKDVTKFLGIPVDGTKSEMIQKLKAKGFTQDSYIKELLKDDLLEGEFNGTDVYVDIVTNNNKVWRIALMDKVSCGETDIKRRFNKLCRQFENNPKYHHLSQSYILSDEEDISHEILVNDKRYEAVYVQKLGKSEDDYMSIAKSSLKYKYTEEQLDEVGSEAWNEAFEVARQMYVEDSVKKSVWLMIDKDADNKYLIRMFYDNKYNKANGEDL